MDDLTAFIAARLDEDEAMALAAATDVSRLAGRANWTSEAAMVTDAEDLDWAICDLSPYVDDECLARHIARHDPARVLREVTAKRAILARYERGAAGDLPEWTAGRELIIAGLAMLEGVLRDLAVAWSDHPHYQPAWAPS